MNVFTVFEIQDLIINAKLVFFYIIKNKNFDSHVLDMVLHTLKGQSHEIFLLWFFSSICSFWSY